MRTLAIALAVFTICCPVSAENYQYHPVSPMKLGWGFSLLNPTEAIPSCLDLTQGADRPDAGSSPQLSSSLVTSQEDMYRKLNIDANLSAHYMFANVSANFSMEQEVSFHSDDTTWMMKAYANFGKRSLKLPVTLTADAKALAALPNKSKFYDRCGEEYAIQEERASQIVAIFTAHHLDKSLKQKIETSVSGGYSMGAGGVDLSASYRDALNQASKASTVNLTVYAFGGKGVTALASLVVTGDNLDSVRQKLSDYVGTLTYDNSIPISFTTGHYSRLIGDAKRSVFGTPPGLVSEYFAYLDTFKKATQLHQIIHAEDAEYAYLTDAQLGALTALANRYQLAAQALFNKGVSCLAANGQNSTACNPPQDNLDRIVWPTVPDEHCTAWVRGECMACSFVISFMNAKPPSTTSVECTHMRNGVVAEAQFNGYVTASHDHPDNKIWNVIDYILLSRKGEDCRTETGNEDVCFDGHISGGNALLYTWKPLHVSRSELIENNVGHWQLTLTKCQVSVADNQACDTAPPGLGSPFINGGGFPQPPTPAIITVGVKKVNKQEGQSVPLQNTIR